MYQDEKGDFHFQLGQNGGKAQEPGARRRTWRENVTWDLDSQPPKSAMTLCFLHRRLGLPRMPASGCERVREGKYLQETVCDDAHG